MSSGNDLLNFSNSNALDPFFRKPGFEVSGGKPNSAHVYTTWGVHPNVAFRRRPIDAHNSLQQYGGAELIFKYDQSAWQRGEQHLKVTRSALTGTGGATFARFVDWEGFAMIDYIDFKYCANLLYHMTGEELMLRARLWEGIKALQELRELVLGDKSPAE